MEDKIDNEVVEEDIIDVDTDNETGSIDILTEMQSRIRKLLEIYPMISPTMLQAGLGPQIPPAKWRPALDKMLETGEVIQDNVYKQGFSGRCRNYARLALCKGVNTITQ